MTQIKICGLTLQEDVQTAVELGADMVGFIHVSGSPRYVDAEGLATLLGSAGKARKVIVVQDEPEENLQRLRGDLNFDDFQFHGSESPEVVKRWGGYKVIHMKMGPPDQALIDSYKGLFLLDTQVENQRGGTGKVFDWKVLPQVRGDFLVAGGLTPENVSELIQTYHPWGVDVSSGVELEPGCKDHEKLKTFIQSIRRSERS